ncbi:MAG: hypothetical protein AAFP86_01345 [Planctomycetota bacterium]
MQRGALLLAALVAAALLALLALDGAGEGPDEPSRAAAGTARGEGDERIALKPPLESEGRAVATGRAEDPSIEDAPALLPAVAPEGPFRLHVRVTAAGHGEPLAGWSVALTEVGAKSAAPGDAAHRDRLDADGRCVFEDLHGTGPWNVIVRPAAEQRYEPFRAVSDQRVGAALATNAENTDAALFEARTGPLVRLTSPLPAGVEPDEVLVELKARPSPFSSQTGGLGGSTVAVGDAVGHPIALVPAITNVVRSDGATVSAWSLDGRWHLRSEIPGAIRNDAVLEVTEPWVEGASIRFELPGDAALLDEWAGWAIDLPQAGDVGDALADAWRNARSQRLTNGSIEVIGLVPGPVWLPEIEFGDGRRVDAIQVQASTEPGPAVVLRVTPAPR